EELSAWIEEGGHFGLLMVPEQSNTFRIMSRKLGIIETSGVYEPYTSIRFLTDLLPMFQNGALHQDDSLLDTTLGVRLSGDCTVHMETGDERRLPLLWRDGAQYDAYIRKGQSRHVSMRVVCAGGYGHLPHHQLQHDLCG
ncbi:MAG: hypothetical protein RR367_09350, partial [Clostridia bacterium]